jgi:hypothetical protein
MDELLTETQVAQRIGVTTRSLQKWRKMQDANGLPFRELGASPKLKTIRYRLADVIAYEERRKVGALYVPEACRRAMRRAADTLDALGAKASANKQAVIFKVRDELRGLIGECA